MTWQLGAFTILGLALVGGFAWYERMRPDARIVALVATLAAFGALGRIAFAAVPNVKPTTDIVLISGYALGGAPGFAVGALAGLSSNFFFGQGPWTPWQMAAWGATGVAGAMLAWVTTLRRPGREPRIGRLTLAAVCGVLGFAFPAVQDVGDWVTFSDHSLGQLGAYVGQGLGFDAIHAVGCVAFALAMGPALIRSIQRFARRLHVHWVPPGTAFPLLAVVGVIGGLSLGAVAPPAARASGGTPAAAARASGGASPAAYLLGAQNPDGGFGAAPGQPSSGLYSGWAALGLAAVGHNPLDVTRGGHSVIGYVRSGASVKLDTGSLERTILVAGAAGVRSQRFGGQNLVAALQGRAEHNGSLSGQVNLTAFAVLALRAAGAQPPGAMTAWLAGQQDRDGGFGFSQAGGQSDSDDTGAVLEALAGQTGDATVRAKAVGYLRGRQDRDGGFPSQPGMGSNAQSTAWAIQGLDAAGVDPNGLHRAGAVSPLEYLRSLITPSGSVLYSRGENQTPVWVTGEALMALEGKPLPLAAAPAAPLRRRSAPARRTTRAIARTRKPVPHPRPRPRRVAPAPPPSARQSVLALAAAAGLATAVALAPVGLG